jgi:UDP-N-acetylglucosamine pyrophosphorylase
MEIGILKKIINLSSLSEKSSYLKKNEKVIKYLKSNSLLNKSLLKLLETETFFIYFLILINQENIFSSFEKDKKRYFLQIKTLVQELSKVDKFYSSIGGIAGYYLEFITLLKEKKINKNIKFYHPNYLNIATRNKEVNSFIDIGIKNLDKVAFVSPMGGSADRFNLINKKTKEPMPLASLNFLNSTLLKLLIDDLIALEYLYFLKTNKKIIIPMIIMTSDAKNNHKNILDIFKKNRYFHRKKENFYFIKQPMAPVISENKDFLLDANNNLILKPSGHGVIWKLMKDNKVLDNLLGKNISSLLIRQINNPIAYIDYNPLALLGYGKKNKKAFGFLSCPRVVNSKEGMNLLKEIKNKNYSYNYTNIEYTDFKKYNLKDEKITPSSDYSKYPSNTNILFADIKQIIKALKKNEFFNLIINLKTKVRQNNQEIRCARLESTMQNISDYIVDISKVKLKKQSQKNLKTFVLYNKREKTISAIKKKYQSKHDAIESDKKCFYDILNNYFDLLKNHCKVNMPSIDSFDNLLKNKLNFTCYINPILGPMYEIISKKIINCSFKKYFDLYLNISNLHLENIDLSGSLIIDIKNPTFDSQVYKNTKCYLKNIKINNLGIDKTKENNFSQNIIKRKESFKIILNENSFFYAKDLVINNNFIIEVPKNYKAIAFMENNKIKYTLKKIK